MDGVVATTMFSAAFGLLRCVLEKKPRAIYANRVRETGLGNCLDRLAAAQSISIVGRGLERIDRCSIDESVAVEHVHSGLDLVRV